MEVEKLCKDIKRDSSCERLLFEADRRDLSSKERGLPHRLMPWMAILLSSVLFICSIVILLLSSSRKELDCVRRQSAFSPAIEAVLPLQNVQFNGTLDAPSPFKGKGPDVDAAWRSLIGSKESGPFGISDQDFVKLGRPMVPEIQRLTDRQGGGIAVTLEVFHQLHCINFIRKYTYQEYYKPLGSFPNSAEFTRIHIDHCIDMFRQKIMCDGDVGLISFDWVSTSKAPWPDFNTWHTCRNFENIVDWAYRKQAPFFGHAERPNNIAASLLASDPVAVSKCRNLFIEFRDNDCAFG